MKTLTLYEPTTFFVLRDRGGTDREKLDSIVSVAREMERAVAEGEESRAMSRFVDLWSEPGAWDRLPAARQEDFSGLAKKVVCNFHSLFNETWNAADFARLRFPVTILRGVASLPVALRVAEVLAELIPQARLITLPDAGHMAPVTHPQAVARAIVDCLRVTPAFTA